MSLRVHLLAALALVASGCARPGESAPTTLDPEPLPSTPEVQPAPPDDPPPEAKGFPVTVKLSPLATRWHFPPQLKAVSALVPPGAASVSEVREVTLDLEVRNLRSDGQLVMELLGPNGAMYERREVQLVAKDEAAVLKQSFAVPVAGTMIQQHALWGRWEAQFLLDGAPLGAEHFELKP